MALAVHLKGFGLALRSVSQVSMAASSSATLLNTPRRICWRVISANSRSTRLIQDDDVGVKCSGLHIECREQCRRAIALVVVRHRLSTALLHRQARLRAIERFRFWRLLSTQSTTALSGGLR